MAESRPVSRRVPGGEREGGREAAPGRDPAAGLDRVPATGLDRVPVTFSTRGRYGEGAEQEKFKYALTLVFIQCVINAAFAKLRKLGQPGLDTPRGWAPLWVTSPGFFPTPPCPGGDGCGRSSGRASASSVPRVPGDVLLEVWPLAAPLDFLLRRRPCSDPVF